MYIHTYAHTCAIYIYMIFFVHGTKLLSCCGLIYDIHICIHLIDFFDGFISLFVCFISLISYGD